MTAKCGNCHITVSMEDITEGRFDGHLLRDILSWMVHLNISKVFSGRYMVMSLFERSRRLSRPTLPMIFKMKYR